MNENTRDLSALAFAYLPVGGMMVERRGENDLIECEEQVKTLCVELGRDTPYKAEKEEVIEDVAR